MALTTQSVQDAVADGVIALVSVESVQVELAGTRSQRFRAHVKALSRLHGQGGDAMDLQAYLADARNPPLVAGHTYLVAALNSRAYAPALEMIEARETDPHDKATLDAVAAQIAAVPGTKPGASSK